MATYPDLRFVFPPNWLTGHLRRIVGMEKFSPYMWPSPPEDIRRLVHEWGTRHPIHRAVILAAGEEAFAAQGKHGLTITARAILRALGMNISP
jgi:hypothetical protein